MKKVSRMITARQWTYRGVLIAFAITGDGACQAQKADDELGRAVKQTLYDEQAVNLLQVDVAVEGGTVYLSGEVDVYGFKERAEQLAQGVGGVAAVVNKVQVQP
jgi:osmotically-inducible protein OsmY